MIIDPHMILHFLNFFWHKQVPQISKPNKLPKFEGGWMGDKKIACLFEFFCRELSINLDIFHVGIGTFSDVLDNIKKVEKRKRKK